MNLVLDEAEEVDVKTKERKEIGRILLKGDTITLMQEAAPKERSALKRSPSVPIRAGVSGAPASG